MKVCVVGAGALGSTVGGTLAAGGCHVSLIDSYQAHVDAINRRGLRMQEVGIDRTVNVAAAISADAMEPVDLLIVLVKSFHTRRAVQEAARAIGPETVVMSLQNGLGHEDQIAEIVGRERVIAGKTYVGGVFLGPGQVRCGVAGKETIIGELDGGSTERVQRIAAAMNAAGLLTQVSPNIMSTMWDKLLINVAGGALTAITRLPYGGLYSLPELEVCGLAAIGEAMAVARANGIELSIREPREAWDKARAGLGDGFKTSMLQSIEKGQPTEVDFIHGSVVRWGERAGVPTPVNSTLVACVKGIEYAMTDFPGKH